MRMETLSAAPASFMRRAGGAISCLRFRYCQRMVLGALVWAMMGVRRLPAVGGEDAVELSERKRLGIGMVESGVSDEEEGGR